MPRSRRGQNNGPESDKQKAAPAYSDRVLEQPESAWSPAATSGMG
jgi:hypothetical protein